MNSAEFVRIFQNSEIMNEKLIIKENLADTLRLIKENYKFEVLKDITAVDKQADGIELTYRLYSVDDNEDVLVAIIVKDEVESVCSIFDSACADEKEIYDLFGVKFIGNEELKRLYMPESWKGHPLKKDYEENDERLRWND